MSTWRLLLAACASAGLGVTLAGCSVSGGSSEPIATSRQAVVTTGRQGLPLDVFTTFDPNLCGSSAGLDGAWPAFGGCPTDRRSTPQFATQTGSINWTVSTGGAVMSSPAISANGTVIVGSNDGKVRALSPGGSTLWSKVPGLGLAVRSSPAIGSYGASGPTGNGGAGTVYVGTDDGFYALDGASGNLQWTFSSAFVRSSPVVGSDGTVYVAAGAHGSNLGTYLYGINPATGVATMQSQSALDSASSSAPALWTNGGTTYVYVASDGLSPFLGPKTLYQVNATTGAIVWSVALAGVSTSGPAVDHNGTAYIGTGPSATGPATVVAIKSNGQNAWTFSLSCPFCNVAATPALGPDGNVYVGASDGHFYSIDSSTGHQRWVTTLGTNVESSAAIDASGTIYVGSASTGEFVALASTNGNRVFATTTGGPVESSAAISAFGTVFFGTDDSKIYSVGDRYAGFTQGSASTPIGTCANNQVQAGTATTVCLAQPTAGATTVLIYVNGHLTPSNNNCVSVTVNETLEVRSFEYDNPASEPVGNAYLVGSHFAFLTTTATAKHCPIYEVVLFGTPGDDVLQGDPNGTEYISGGPGADYIIPGGGQDVLVSGDGPHTFDLTGPTTASALPSGLEIIGADLTKDKVMVTFDPSTLPTTLFDNGLV
ncbi:MAG: PQQ-binding-like beta-propeller repeat protein, partial [Polyangiaceae bacterium]